LWSQKSPKTVPKSPKIVQKSPNIIQKWPKWGSLLNKGKIFRTFLQKVAELVPYLDDFGAF
jgi:hypothetical protein